MSWVFAVSWNSAIVSDKLISLQAKRGFISLQPELSLGLSDRAVISSIHHHHMSSNMLKVKRTNASHSRPSFSDGAHCVVCCVDQVDIL